MQTGTQCLETDRGRPEKRSTGFEEMVNRLDQRVVSNSLYNCTILIVAMAKFSVYYGTTLSTVGIKVQTIVHNSLSMTIALCLQLISKDL